MRFLNLGCGANRPIIPIWINIDNLHEAFPDPTCPDRVNLATEPNYMNMDLTKGLYKLKDNSVQGILASHVLEHFDLQGALDLLRECLRVLVPGGVLRVSSPCPHKLYDKVYGGYEDWDEPCPDTLDFMTYVLFFIEHKQIIDLQVLKCMFHYVGYYSYFVQSFGETVLDGLADLDNRRKFSVFAEAIKGKDNDWQ